jgi:hypothetical protein
MKQIVAVIAVVASTACIKPPDIVMVDRGTALERQAAGSYEELEQRLDRAAIEPKPESLTPQQLETLGLRPAPAADGAGVTEADRVDALLVQRCVGEGADGLLAVTPDACRGAPDADEAARAVERVNLARRQLWRWMQAQRADLEPYALRHAWRTLHVTGIVCGAWIQGDDGRWRAKEC